MAPSVLFEVSKSKFKSYLPPANEVLGKVIVLRLSVILFTRGMVSQHALLVVSQHALQAGLLGGGIPACLAGDIPACLAGLWGGGSPGPHPGGKLRGLARGASPGSYLGGISRPIPRGVSDPHPGGSPGPHPGGCVFQHALRQTPPHGWLLPRAVRILLECILVPVSLADPSLTPPLVQFVSFSFRFWQKSWQIIGFGSEKSCIRHCKMKLTFTIGPNVLLTEGRTQVLLK